MTIDTTTTVDPLVGELRRRRDESLALARSGLSLASSPESLLIHMYGAAQLQGYLDLMERLDLLGDSQ